MPVAPLGHNHRSGNCLLGLLIADDLQPPGKHVDGLVELIVRVRDWPGEMKGDRDLPRDPRDL